MAKLDDIRIGIIGLGYVGLPLAVLFATRFPVIGFDHDTRRIEDLRGCVDRTLEVEPDALACTAAHFTAVSEDLAACNFYVVTVPTPIDAAKRPDMRLLMAACETVGKVIGKGDIVVFESTVYPGATEEDCVPVIERASGLRFNEDFFAGYSPERVNPGDRLHTIDRIVKVVSGSTPETLATIDAVYGPYWFKGPDFKQQFKIYPPQAQPREAYADHFFCWLQDFSGDGRLDPRV